jgi:hypothetical protein
MRIIDSMHARLKSTTVMSDITGSDDGRLAMTLRPTPVDRGPIIITDLRTAAW